MTGYAKSAAQDNIAMLYTFAATAGRIGGHTRVLAYGHTPAAAANTDTWEAGGLYPFQSAATVLELLSASANDTAAGTGARSWAVSGLDANFNPISEVVATNGVTPVQTVNSYLRVNSLLIASAGSGNVNAGDTTLRVTGAGATQALARAGYGAAKQAIYTVPAGFTLLVTDLTLNVGGVGAVANNITFGFARIGPTGLVTVTTEYIAGSLFPILRTIPDSAPIKEKTTFSLRIMGTNTATSGYAAFEGILVDNTQLS